MSEEIGFAIVGLRRGFQAAKEVVATQGARLVAVADQDVPQEFGTPPEREVLIPPEEDAPANWCEDVVSALSKGTTVACDGRQGRRSVLVNQAIYECARTGKPVRIDE